MSASKEQVADFYDKMWDDFEKKNWSKPNSRHRTIFKNLKKAGMQTNATVLEIGCGIGSLSRLIIAYLRDGFFTGADISPQTIEFLKRKFAGNNKADFVVTDMADFKYPKKFDFVVFPDVLEHIPAEAHDVIFKTLKNLVHENSVILINNPEPLALEWVHKNKPEWLQIIDQPLHVNHFAKLAYENGFYIERVEPYALHTEEFDYQNIVMKPNKPLRTVTQKSKGAAIAANIKSRL